MAWTTPWEVPQEANSGFQPGGMVDSDDTVRVKNSAELNSWEEMDITGFIQKILSGDVDNYGFLFKNDDYPNNSSRDYASSEYTADKTLRPKLTIVYGENAVMEPNSVTASKQSKRIKFTTLASEVLLNISVDGAYEVRLTSLSGRIIRSFNGNGISSYSINKSGLQSACYFVSVIKNGAIVATDRLLLIK